MQAGQPLQAIPYRFCLSGQFTHWHPGCRQRQQGEIHIREIIVDDGADHTPGQIGPLIEHAFADLIEEVRHFFAGRRILESDNHGGLPGPDGCFNGIGIRHLLNSLFQTIHDLILQHLRGCSWPDDRNHHRPDGERRVFRPTKGGERVETGNNGQQKKKEGDRTLAHCQRGKIR